MKKLTTEEWIINCQKIHGNKYSYSLSEYINCRNKVKIICPTHGIFEQTASNHLHNGYGCESCSRELHRLTTISTKDLSKFKTIHNSKYQYNTSVVNGKIEITYPTHGKFEQSIYTKDINPMVLVLQKSI